MIPARKIFLLLFLLEIICGTAQPIEYTAQIKNAQLSKGYYFLYTYRMRKQAVKIPGQQLIINGSGHAVYYRTSEIASDFMAHASGLMSYYSRGKFIVLNPNFKVIDSVSCVNGIETDPHDFLILPNGHYILIGFDVKDADLSQYKIFMQNNSPGSKRGKIKYNVIQELDKNKNLIYQWNSKDHFNVNDASKVYLNDSLKFDVVHFNSVDVNSNGDFLVSARYFNEVFKIERKTGNILWRMGGPNNQIKCVNDSIPFLGQHHALFSGKENITLFDNGYAAKKTNVRALEYKINEKEKTAELMWTYKNASPMVSEANGNLQKFKDGTAFISYGKLFNGTPNITCEKVDERGEPVFVLSFKDTVGSYRCYHYPKLPFKLSRPVLTIKEKEGIWYLSANKKFEEHKWNTGEQTDTIKIKEERTYFVYVPDGTGGYLSSEVVTVKKTKKGFKLIKQKG